jgi:hypothetical protein
MDAITWQMSYARRTRAIDFFATRHLRSFTMLDGSTSSLIDGLLKTNPWPMVGDSQIIKIVWACGHPSSLQVATHVNLDTF